MGTRRRLVGALTSIVAALTLLTVAAPAGAGALDACAQRVIRDWYSGGRVDNVYPLRCYRAAIRALPSDVLQYSDADQDIRRALAFARRGRSDPGDGAASPAPSSAPTTTPEPKPQTGTSPPEAAVDVAAPPRPTGVAPETAAASASVPYPVIALAGLAGVLLLTGAAALLAARRR